MGKLNKEQAAHLSGMQFALKIAKEGGINALEKECMARSMNGISVNLTQNQLHAIARQVMDRELKYLAAAIADAVTNTLLLPPSEVKRFLRTYNERMVEFRNDPEEFERVCSRLDSDVVVNMMIKNYMEEE